jgi:hypothetical protein
MPCFADGSREATSKVRFDRQRERLALHQILAAPVRETCSTPCDGAIRSLLVHCATPGVLLLFAWLSGEPTLRWTSAYLSVKDAHSDATPWHQDWWCWTHPVSHASPPPQVAVLCYLTGADRHTGAVRVWPGSQRHTRACHESLQGITPHTDSTQAHEVSVEGVAGDAIAVDYRAFHGAHPNHSDAPRLCLILNFAPHWSSLPSELRAHLIQGTGLPSPAERSMTPPALRAVLPVYSGVRRDYPLNRIPTVGLPELMPRCVANVR